MMAVEVGRVFVEEDQVRGELIEVWREKIECLEEFRE
jgi:hypothetical protein